MYIKKIAIGFVILINFDSQILANYKLNFIFQACIALFQMSKDKRKKNYNSNKK